MITAKIFPERQRHISRLAEIMGFSFEYVSKYDADALEPDDLKLVSDQLSPASVSNVLKHLEAQRMFLRTANDCALIFEDDVILFEQFFLNLSLVLSDAAMLRPGWLIFLGGADNKIDARFARSSNICLIEKPMTTAEAYLVDRKSCQMRVKWLRKNIIDRQADHQLKQMDSQLGITHYCVSHPMATQGSILGLFKTSLDKSRAKHISAYLRLRFEYNRFRRQTIPRAWEKLKKRFF